MRINHYTWSTASEKEFYSGGYNGAEVFVYSKNWARIAVYNNKTYMGVEVSPEQIIELRDFLNEIIEQIF